jgi:hypothetical protein
MSVMGRLDGGEIPNCSADPTLPSPGRRTQTHEAHGEASGRRVRRVGCDAFSPGPGRPEPQPGFGKEKIRKCPSHMTLPTLFCVRHGVTVRRAATDTSCDTKVDSKISITKRPELTRLRL